MQLKGIFVASIQLESVSQVGTYSSLLDCNWQEISIQKAAILELLSYDLGLHPKLKKDWCHLAPAEDTKAQPETVRFTWASPTHREEWTLQEQAPSGLPRNHPDTLWGYRGLFSAAIAEHLTLDNSKWTEIN